MLNRLIFWSINNKLIVAVFTFILLIIGIKELGELPIDAVPDITNNQVQIITVSPSSGAEDIERLVTFPVEQAVASISGIEELRSFSRFGLSVVTVVFSENTDIFWARQQVAERLGEVKNEIPTSLGEPAMAPLTTGLGEIYQYTLSVKPGFESSYSPTDLRTLQDWLVRRQLLGVSGVADVSGFGGHIKTYEVSINPQALKSFGLTIADVFKSIEANNQNTGGAYIEREGMTTYIRAEGLLHNLDEIEQITIGHNDQGMPITVNQVAKVQLGKAVRYGALTYNEQGEAVGGIVMMLKGANSDQTINAVKSRIEEIRTMLPKGVEIAPYLDRSDLVQRAIHTVSSNLIEGALIVIFVLVLLLGNLRAGLVVASVIPLAMLFAVILMNLFGVSGNLMSLGALDFGLIVDGAVIIVEATLHVVSLHQVKKISQLVMNNTVYNAASKFSKSAVFGQIIILVVYLPILSLVGIEGKMFKPMALTVMFAIVGALILSLTYVPMMSSLVLSKRITHRKSISDRIMDRITRIYRPMFFAVLRRQRLVISIIVVFLMLSIVLFSRLGAEFIPNLDEGDFAVEMRLMPGASLTNTIAKTEQASKVLLENFSEVKKVVGKIGTAEIPTDPMPMEACDLMIILNDKSQWKNAESKEDLADLMKKTLERNMPGVDFGFQQPIQMRFNELMTGAKQDVVVKIYGEEFTMLENYADQIGKQALKIKGVEDLYVEQLEGLPQLLINYNRPALARYGVSIEEVNEAINAGFAGSSAGYVYEGEKRFSLVVRLDSMYRAKSMDLNDIFVDSKVHAMIPITELATISYKAGLNQIQRDNAKRRVLVGFNVRGRDVKSVVDELKLKMNKHIAFSPGYNFTVGGSFKNLEEASARLLIAVPAALLLIFFLLYLTFNSLKQALIIFTAIPLASIGGIWALFIRDMPFSISAGIGFIALFGVAVLNGIVLITEYNTLKRNGEHDRLRIVIKGTLSRLRPVLLTATVASLGFLPMALSHGSGAEVQKPLATVVIGGLISATFLTLFFLPILYFMFGVKTRFKVNVKSIIPIILLFFGNQLFAQSSVSDLIKLAVSKDPGLKADSIFILQAKPEALGMVQVNKLDVNAMIGQYNSNYRRDNNFSIQQVIPFPTAFKHAKSLGVERAKERMLSYEFNKLKVEEEAARSIEQWLYLTKKQAILSAEDSTLMSLETKVSMRFNSGETNGLESWLLASDHLLIQQQLVENQRLLIEAQSELVKRVFLSEAEIESLNINYELLVLDSLVLGFKPQNSPQWKVSNQSLKTIAQENDLQRSLAMPDIQLGYFNQTLVGNIPLNGGVAPFTSADRFQGGSFGLSIPLLSRSTTQRNKWLMLESERIKYDLVRLESALTAQFNSLISQYNSYKAVYDQLQSRVKEVSKGVQLIADTQIEQGDIDQVTWLNLKRNLIKIQLTELDMKHQLNQLVVQIRYLNLNQK